MKNWMEFVEFISHLLQIIWVIMMWNIGIIIGIVILLLIFIWRKNLRYWWTKGRGWRSAKWIMIKEFRRRKGKIILTIIGVLLIIGIIYSIFIRPPQEEKIVTPPPKSTEEVEETPLTKPEVKTSEKKKESQVPSPVTKPEVKPKDEVKPIEPKVPKPPLPQPPSIPIEPFTPPLTSTTPIQPSIPPVVEVKMLSLKDKQDPSPGKLVEPDKEVELTIAKWPVVPDVTKKTLNQAKEEIKAADNLFNISVQPPHAPDDWIVYEQEPGGDKKAPKETTVIIRVRPPKLTVPLVRGKIPSDAIKKLKEANLDGRVVGTTETTQYLSGRVAQQDPEADTEVNRGAEVRLWTATPPPSVEERYRSGLQKMGNREYDEAIRLFRQVLEEINYNSQSQYYTRTYWNLVLSYFKAKQYGSVIQSLKDSQCDLVPNVYYWYYKGIAHYEKANEENRCSGGILIQETRAKLINECNKAIESLEKARALIGNWGTTFNPEVRFTPTSSEKANENIERYLREARKLLQEIG